LENADIINSAWKYFDFNKDKVLKALIKETAVTVDFMEFAKISPEAAELVLERFSEVYELFKEGLKATMDDDDLRSNKKVPDIKFINLPESQRIMIGNLRATNMDSLIFTDGKIRYKSEVRPKTVSIRYECPNCTALYSVIQLGEVVKEMNYCKDCGRKGRFRMLSKEFVDAQILSIQENFRDLQSGEQPREIKVIVSGKGLTNPMLERRYLPGSTVRVIGYLKEQQKYSRTGNLSTTSDIVIEANNIINLEQEAGDIEITDEEEKKILEISKSPNLYKWIYDAIAPGIMGQDIAKRALILFLFNGPKLKDQVERIRGISHMLFIGDPATAKSKMLSYLSKIHPRAGFAAGPGMTPAGLTSTVIKDEHFGWILEGGALSLYNGGALIIDELEKATDEAKNCLHTPMEDGQYPVHKANISTVLPSETAIIASANPKNGRFDIHSDIRSQIELPDTLFSRFDLVIPFFDRPSDDDKNVANFILKKFEYAGKGTLREELVSADNPFRDPIFFKKYVLYATRHSNPIVTEIKCKSLEEFFTKIRKMGGENSLAITFRQMETLPRLACAHAKIRMAEYVTKTDADFVIQLYKDMIKLYGWDIDAGQVPDMQAIFEPGLPWSKVEQKNIIIETLKMAMRLNDTTTIMRSLLVDALLDQGIFDNESSFESLYENLRKVGEVYVPKTVSIEDHREEFVGVI
jgi:replicative DNA helicase Mcm